MSSKRKIRFKELAVEIIHLTDSESKQIIVEKDLINKIKKSDQNIFKVILQFFAIHVSTNLKNFYEDSNVYRFKCQIESGKTEIKSIKKILISICLETDLTNTLFSPNFETIKYVSRIDRLIPRQIFQPLNSFSFGTLIDLTRFIEHYQSLKTLDLNVAKDDIIADFQHDKSRLLLKFRLTSGGFHKNNTKNIRYKLEYEYSSINSAVVWVNTDNMKIYFNLNHPPLLYKVENDDLSYDEEFQRSLRKRKSHFSNNSSYSQKIYKRVEKTDGLHNNEVLNNAFWLRERDFIGCNSETIGKCNVLMIEINNVLDEEKLLDKYSSNEFPDPWRLLYILKRFRQMPIYFANITTHKSVDNITVKNKLIGNISSKLSALKSAKNFTDEGIDEAYGTDDSMKSNAKEMSLKKQEKRKNKSKARAERLESIDTFSLLYAYHSVFSHTFQISDELVFKDQTQEFNNVINNYCKIDASAVEEALFELSTLNDRPVVFRALKAFDSMFSYYKNRNYRFKNEKLSTKSINTEIEYIRRCILTPTRFLVLPPQPTLRSRFIVSSDPDFTIRLSVREDDYQALSFSMRCSGSLKKQTDFLKKVIKDPLMNGIKIGGRRFEFLGSSSSQLRDSGMVLYAKDKEGRTASSIRESIGDMSRINRNVAKYVSRLGLAFSQVMTHIEIDKSIVKMDIIPDIEGGLKHNYQFPETQSDERYVFSDGIGMVSRELTQNIYKKLSVECRNKPSAMQIRFGGIKGMIVINPELEGQQILFRNSMKKYDSNETKLGILKISFPRPLHLNRPMITILEQLGVESKVFVKLLMDNLKNMANSLICECYAVTLLQESSTLGIPYRKLFESGIPFLSEPMFREIVNCVINHRITELKTKARIKVPMNRGRTLFGVLDETKTLEYGQLFVQLSHVDEDNMPENKCFTLKGEVMVTKFPCLHPGDVRKFQAIDIPALHHIKDCIVFPANGLRPHPDEMAGSDLDGDEYAIIFDFDDLIFKGDNKDAMHFPSYLPEELDRAAEVEDILDFYCYYILSNNVGLIASAHLANADLLKGGIFNPICMSLAKKYSVALDFAKTGRGESIEWIERPKLYPDFMDKFSQKRTYLSNNCLGQLYRHCDRYEMGMQSKANLEISTKPNIAFELEGWKKYEKSASVAYNSYRTKISYLLNRFGVENEAKLLSGAFSKTSKYMTGRQESRDVHELLQNLVEKVFIEFRNRFRRESETDYKDERRQRASAWYMIPFAHSDEANTRYFGFSWTISEELCDLMKNRNSKYDNKENHDCTRLSTSLIDDYFETNNIYKEPEIDSQITEESDKRQIIMEKRYQTAEQVLKAWLERQDHLFEKKIVGKKYISSVDDMMSDMERKLKRKLMKIWTQVMSEAKHELHKPLKSAGNIVISFMKDCIDEWLSINELKNNNRVIDSPTVKLGFSSLITLNHFFRTRQISHIISLNPRFEVSIKTPISVSTFYIAIPKNKKHLNFVHYIIRNNKEMTEKIRSFSGCIEITLESYAANTGRLNHYYLLTATGTVWSLQTVKNFISHQTFLKSVCSHKYRKDNHTLEYQQSNQLTIA